ncbi:MAG: hypothetical protein F4X97_08505 [Boseongicola sp. SB0662_bin_57]|nr:hypothetical protein [Boseongicola sp. SB0662_bin_57]
MNTIEHKYIAPDFLKVHAVKEWIRNNAVEEDFKTLATDQIMGSTSSNAEARKRLALAYSEHTGEQANRAKGPIDVVTGILAAGYISSMSSRERPLAGMFQRMHGDFNSRLDDFEEKHVNSLADLVTEKFPIVQQILSPFAEDELRDILALRSLESQTARQKILQLFERVNGGDLSTINESSKQDVFQWTARLCAERMETLAFAKDLRESLAKSEPSPNLAIIDALIREAEGDADGALRDLRDAGDQDSRSVWFGILMRAKGALRALKWFDQSGVVDQENFFSGPGWVDWAYASASCGRWEDAAATLPGSQPMWDEIPALAIAEGRINAALLLPDEFRNRVLDGPPLFFGIAPISSAAAAGHHARSLECFRRAEQILRGRIGKEWLNHLADWTLWLRLMEPDAGKRNAERERVGAEMADAETSVALVPFVHSFGIDYDRKPLEAYLDKRRELGGLDERARVAEFFVNRNKLRRERFKKYFEENEEHLQSIIPPALFVSTYIESILTDEDSLHDARRALERHRDSLDKHHFKRLEMMIDAYEGQDIRNELEEQYGKTDSIIDLRNLIEFLKRRNDREALRPLCLELFQRFPTEEIAIDVVASYSGPSFLDHERILSFLDECGDLLNHSEALLNAKSIALFHAGKYVEAEKANERSKQKRLTTENLLIGVKVAIASGNWAVLGGMVTAAWGLREQLDAFELVSLASLVGQESQSRERALQLLRLAADRAPDDAAVLAAVCWQFFRLGHEEEADPQWLLRAAELSTDDEGPVRSMSLRYVVEDWLPKRRKHLVEVDRKWTQGEIPIGMMADKFGVSLSRLLLDLSSKNAKEADGRHRVALPIIAAGRPDTEIEDDWTVGVDVTSVLVLHHLGILDASLDVFRHVKFSPDIFEHLFREKAEAHFHQPSRIAGAKQVLRLHDQRQIRTLNLEGAPPRWLVEETGRATAEVLQWARNEKAMAVCTRPIYAVGSLMQREANLGEYEDVTISLTSLCSWLKEDGRIEADAYGRICSVLRNCGDTEDSGIPSDLATRQFCFDDVVLDYLNAAHVLQPIVAALGKVLIRDSAFADMRALADEEESEDRVVSGIESIRRTITSRLEEGTASFLPQPAAQILKDAERSFRFKASASLLGGGSQCDALCIDDRFLNSHSHFIGSNDQAKPILTVLDVIKHLMKFDLMPQEDYIRVRHRLRAAGFAFVPLEAEEICHWLRATGVREGQTVESVELRVLRQSTALGDSLALTNWHQAFALVSNSRAACTAAISEMWHDTDLASEAVVAHTSWIWRNLMETIVPGHQALDFDEYGRLVGEVVSLRVGSVLLPLSSIATARKDDYANWIEQTVLQHLWPANSDRIHAALLNSRKAIEAIADHDTNQAAYGNLILELLPEKARALMFRDDPEFAKRSGYSAESVISIGPTIQIVDRDLFSAATAALVEGGEATALDLADTEMAVTYDGKSQMIRLSWLDAERATQEVDMADLCLLSPSSEVRLTAFDRIADRLGPTFESKDQLREEIGSAVPEFSTVSRLLEESFNGVAATQASIADKILGGKQVGPSDFVPESMEYFERFVAPPPVDQTANSFVSDTLAQHRCSLLGRELEGGLHICCLGAVHDELSPGQWLADESDDDVWSALRAANSELNPFSRLGALDVALYRQHDHRFRDFASKAVEQLLDENFGFDEERDVYGLLQIVGNFVLNRIGLLKDGATKPGYWKQLGAWMQAGYVVETMLRSRYTVDLGSLEKWAGQYMSAAGAYAGLVDARVEPMLFAAQMTSDRLRHEVLGRLEALRRRHEQNGREVPASGSIDGKLEELEKSGLKLALWFPGPLEGDRRPDRAPPDHVNEQIEELAQAKDGDIVLPLVTLSQLHCLNERQLELARLAVESACDAAPEMDVKETSRALQTLERASVVAAANRSASLCSSIGDGVVRISSLVTEKEVEVIPRILLQAAAALEEEHEWYSWLDKKLVEVVDMLPSHPNQSLYAFLDHLEEIGTILPVKRWFHARARSATLVGLA